MTEIAQVEETAPGEVDRFLIEPETRIQRAAADMRAAAYVARSLVNTMFVPREFQGKAAEAAAAILFGDKLGMDPMTSLQQIFVISGKPALYARAMVGIAQQAGHDIWTEESTPESVTVCGRRKGTDHTESSTWTFKRAERAGYTKNAKYRTEPEAMLYARAASEVVRKIASDALLGFAHSVEEMELVEADRPTAASGVARLAAALDPQDAEVVVDEQPAGDES